MDRFFIDKKNRKIEVLRINRFLLARFGGEKIGSLEVDYIEDGVILLYEVNVRDGFRRSGIATELIRIAKKEFGNLKIPLPHREASGEQKEDGHFLTQDGEALVESCFRKGILDRQ